MENLLTLVCCTPNGYFFKCNFCKKNFSFYGTTLQGAKEMKPRWKRVLATIDGSVGEALGQIFVDKYFDAESKKKVNQMVDNLFTAFKERIKTRVWMGDTTKQKALDKLAKIMRKLGYPDKWKDYTTLDIKNDSYVANVLRSNHYEYKRMINKIGKPVDKTEWGMSPPTVNAYYNPSYNEIVFPAGIMQPPFFDKSMDDAVNFGGIGLVIGHELTHGFDDQGRKFDPQGNLRDWWTETDGKEFERRVSCVADEYSNFVAVDNMKLNGGRPLGGNKEANG